MPYLDDAEIEAIKQKARADALLDREAQQQKNRLTVDDIRRMTPEQIVERQVEVDAVLSDPDSWVEDREEPHLGQDPEDKSPPPADNPGNLSELRAKLDSMPEDQAREWVTEHPSTVDAILGGSK